MNPCECQAELGDTARIAEVSFVFSLSCTVLGSHCGICVNVKLYIIEANVDKRVCKLV